MNRKTTRFVLKEGRIWLVVEHLVWGEWLLSHEEDVTDKILPVIDDHLDTVLGKVKYTGE